MRTSSNDPPGQRRSPTIGDPLDRFVPLCCPILQPPGQVVADADRLALAEQPAAAAHTTGGSDDNLYSTNPPVMSSETLVLILNAFGHR